MKTNITTDNYEAYLLDYMEGNLNPESEKELKAFIAAQGLDWDELTAPLPYLEAPQVAYEDKEKLKKKATVVPLYVKIASVAAAAGLLLTVSQWPEKSMPEVEPIAELKPILPGRLITTSETTALPPRTTHFVQSQVVRKEKKPVSKTASAIISETISKKVETTLLAQLEPQKAQILPTSTTIDEPDFDLLAYSMSTNLALAQIEANRFDDFPEDEADDRELSLIGRGLLWLTNGRLDSFDSLIGAGVRKAKQNAADMALTAYSNLSEHIEETKERWEER